MITTLIIIALAFYWLLSETDYLRIRLLIGDDKPKHLARYKAYNSLKKKKYYNVPIYSGGNTDDFLSTEITYDVVLAPGITEPLCGWDWLDKHCADLVGFENKVYLAIAGVKYDMTIKSPSILNEVMKVNKLNKKERLQYA